MADPNSQQPRDPATWLELLNPKWASLIKDISQTNAITPTAVMRWRKQYPAGIVQLALELVDARKRGQAKFGSHAQTMLMDRIGVEQSSSLRVAQYKASTSLAHKTAQSSTSAAASAVMRWPWQTKPRMA